MGSVWERAITLLFPLTDWKRVKGFRRIRRGKGEGRGGSTSAVGAEGGAVAGRGSSGSSYIWSLGLWKSEPLAFRREPLVLRRCAESGRSCSAFAMASWVGAVPSGLLPVASSLPNECLLRFDWERWRCCAAASSGSLGSMLRLLGALFLGRNPG
jgi:hypothetical protein